MTEQTNWVGLIAWSVQHKLVCCWPKVLSCSVIVLFCTVMVLFCALSWCHPALSLYYLHCRGVTLHCRGITGIVVVLPALSWCYLHCRGVTLHCRGVTVHCRGVTLHCHGVFDWLTWGDVVLLIAFSGNGQEANCALGWGGDGGGGWDGGAQAAFWTTPGLKDSERLTALHILSSRELNFCVRSTPLEGKWRAN